MVLLIHLSSKSSSHRHIEPVLAGSLLPTTLWPNCSDQLVHRLRIAVSSRCSAQTADGTLLVTHCYCCPPPPLYFNNPS